MKKQQKGASSILGIIIIILILGGIWWAYKNNQTPIKKYTETENNSATSNSTNAGTNSNTGTNSNVLTPTNNTQTTQNNPTVISGNSNVFPGGSEYRSPFGLTLALPANWAAYAITKNTVSYGGVIPTDSTTLRLASGPVLTINVFTKEQWNNIKTQENSANQNTNSLGEGEYLGENSTYIYSYIILDREAEVRQILANIISF